MFAEAIVGSLEYNLITVTQADISDKMVGESLHKLRGVFLVQKSTKSGTKSTMCFVFW